MKTPNIIKIIFTDILSNKNQILNKSINFIFLVVVLSIFIIFQPPKIRVGQILNEDIIADRDIKYIDNEATQKREEIIKATTPPVFIYDTKIVRDQQNLLNEISQKIISSKNYNEIKILTGEYDIDITASEYNDLSRVTSFLVVSSSFSNFRNFASKSPILILSSHLEAHGVIESAKRAIEIKSSLINEKM